MSDEKIDKLISAAKLLHESIDDNFHTEFYPDKNDNLLGSEGGIWQLDACLGYVHNEIDLYMAGYLSAARTLAQSVGLTRHSVDQSVYPIIFLYRHYIELSLKSLITRGSFACNDLTLTTKDEKVIASHDLGELWRVFKPIFCELWSEKGYFDVLDFQDLVDGIDSHIKQLCSIDKNSFSFRYSRQKDRKTRNLEGITNINIMGFVEKIERLIMVLQGCEWDLDALEDASDIMVPSNI